MRVEERVPPRLSQLLWRSFLGSGSFVIGAAGTAITFIAWIRKPDVAVSLPPLVLVGTAGAMVLATALRAATVAHAAALKRLPAVRLAKSAPPSYRGIRGILLLDPSDLFVTDAAVSVYALEAEGYEQMIGLGRVMTIQDNGYIQIGITHVVPEQEDTLTKVLANEHVALKSIIVKPHMPVSLYTQVGEQS